MGVGVICVKSRIFAVTSNRDVVVLWPLYKTINDMKNYKRHLVTSALPYANGPVHIGHLAGVYVPSDIYTRYLRLRGCDVLSVCGSDEHGVPITIKARGEGVTPQNVVDKYHAMIRDAFVEFGISFDIYHRTSSKMHHATASDFFRTLYDGGKFIEQTTEQYYDGEAQQFLADRYITGTCPKCGADGAYGDQCEKCGSTLSAMELINPRSAISGATPELRETRHWFLPLDQYEAQLKKWILEDHKNWKPNVYGQCKSWLDGGLMPRAVSRDLDWGIPVPVEGAQGKVLYVWFDAPIGYISATKELFAERGDVDGWKAYWKSEDTKIVNFIGKDNIVFHCIVFPAMLMAHGGYVLPDNVPANEFLNLENDKISTSRNWAVWLHEYLEDFPGQQDVLRYVLCANAPESKDNDFTWRDFQARNNNELVAIFGNFVNRAMVLTAKYFDGCVPACGALSEFDEQTLATLPQLRESLEWNVENYKFREALKDMMSIARLGNKYLADTEPWKVVKTDEQRTATILNVSLQIAANLAIACEPFMPFTSSRLVEMLGCTSLEWDMLGRGDILEAGHRLGEAQLLFSKVENEQVQVQLDKLEAAKVANAAVSAVVGGATDSAGVSGATDPVGAGQVEGQKGEVSFDDFARMDIRVSRVLAAERVAKTQKLLKLTVDTGIDTRTIVSGIAEHYTPEEMVGRQVMVLVNLAPRVMRGIESQGMILMAADPAGAGKLVLAGPQTEVSVGSVIG